jgi:hypothetical protein
MSARPSSLRKSAIGDIHSAIGSSY